MEDRNSHEAIAARANQLDPIVMYLIVKESLSMSIGKTAAQCAHASQMLTLKYFSQKFKDQNSFGFCSKTDLVTNILVADIVSNILVADHLAMKSNDLFEEWLNNSFRKVVLRASDHQFERMKKEITNHIVVVDAGLTEIESGSETVLGLWPMYRSTCPKYLTKLQVLK